MPAFVPAAEVGIAGYAEDGPLARAGYAAAGVPSNGAATPADALAGYETVGTISCAAPPPLLEVGFSGDRPGLSGR